MHKVGIIGFGKMGMLHGALLEGTRDSQITAICDKSFVMRFGFKRVHKNVRTYKDAKKMLDKEKLDIVIVSTPTFNHRDSVLNALQHGCHVFVEKPLAINLKQGEDIVTASKKVDKLVQVGFCNRFAMSIMLAKEKIEAQVIGEVRDVEAKMYIADVFEPHVGWRYKKDLSGGGALMDFGIHMVDLLIWYFGKISTVEATCKKLYSLEVEDEVNSVINFKNGLKCKFQTSWSREEYRKSYTNLKVIGTKGIMEITDQTLDIYDLDGTKNETYAYPELYNGSFMDIGGLLYSHQISEFLKYIKTGGTQGCTAEQAMYVQKVIECMYRSSEENSTIDVEDEE